MEGEEDLLKDARRLLAVNAGEQKRLEKLQRHIDKKRREKERMLTRAQREAVVKFYENAGKELNEFLFVEKIYKREGQHRLKGVASSEVDFKGHEMNSTDNTILKEANEKRKRKQQKLSMQENDSNTFLPGLELTVLSLKAGPFQRTRSRSWSSPSEGRGHEEKKHHVKEEEQNLQQKQNEESKDNSLEEEEVNSSKERPEKPLSAILPPLVLPPLHLHRRPSLQEHNKNFYKGGRDITLNNKKTLKEHYDELSECRYLRVYQRKKK